MSKKIGLTIVVGISILSLAFILAVTFNNGSILYSTGNNVQLIADQEINVSQAIINSNSIELYNLTYYNPLAEGNSSIAFLNITRGEFINNSLCYQETANVSTECGGLSTGKYSFETNYMYINYSLPFGSYGAIWQIKHGDSLIENITILDSCFNMTLIQLRIFSNTTSGAYGATQPQCYNGSWNNIGTNTVVGGWASSGTANTINSYDGNWNSASQFYYLDYWSSTNVGSPPTGGAIYEEAIYWNITHNQTLTSYFPYSSKSLSTATSKHIVSNLTQVVNATLVINTTGIIPVNLTYVSNTGTYRRNYTMKNYTWNQAGKYIIVNITGIEKNMSSNILTITNDTIFPNNLTFASDNSADGINTTYSSIFEHFLWQAGRNKNLTVYIYNSSGVYDITSYDEIFLDGNYEFPAGGPVDYGIARDGVYYYNFSVCNYQNQCNYSTTRKITIDTGNPTATLSSPANNAYLNNATQNLTATLTDNLGIKNVSLYLNGVLNSTVNYGSSIVSSTVGIVLNMIDGIYTWFYRIFDWAGNTADSTTRTFTIDTTYPSINLTYPLNTTYTTVLTAINFTRSDTNLANCWYSTNGGTTNISNNNCNNLTGLTANQGSNTWMVGVNDSANNRNASYVTFFVDSINPTINFTNPTEINATYLNRNYILINVTSTDTNLANITINLYNSTGIVNTTTSATSPNYVNISGLVDNIYYFNATSTDILNNRNYTTTRTVTIDITNPLIDYGIGTENSGVNKSQTFIYVNLSFTEINFANITFTLRNLTSQVNSTTYTTPTYKINWTNLPNTYYTYWVNITDLANNKNSTEVRNIMLDNTNPTAALNTPLNNTHQNQSSNNFTANLTDNLGIQNATLYIYNSTTLVNQTTISYASNTLTATIGIVVNLIDNAYTWFYKLFDWAGNSATSQNFTTNVDEGNLDFCHAIESSGTYYLNKSIVATGNCFEIKANNVIFDCNKSSITGPGGSTTSNGIYTNGYSNITIQNCNITNFGNQINLTNSQNNTIKNFISKSNTLTTFNGIYLKNTVNTNLINLTITNNAVTTFNGIYLSSANSTSIYNSTINSNTGSSSAYSLFNPGSDDYGTNISYSNLYNIKEYGYNLLVQHSTLNSTNMNHISSTVSRSNYLNNVTTDVNWYTVGTTTSIYKQWYFNVNVSKSNGDTNREAFVQIWDKQGANQFSGYTTPAGGVLSNDLLLTEQLINETSPNIFLKTPHTVNISYASFDTNSTQINVSLLNNNILSVTLQLTDVIAPNIQIVYPEAINYSINVSAMNYTSDGTAISCWYSLNGGVTNSTPVSCGINFTGLTSVEGSNTWKIWSNDSKGNLNSSSVTFFKDTIYPLIDYGQGTQNSGVNLSQSNVYINTTWTEINFMNITFNLYNTTLINSTTYTTATYKINWTGLIDNTYYYNVTICDTLNNCNSTSTRKIVLDTTNPNATLLTPVNNTITNVQSNNFTANLSDSLSGIKNATLNIYNSSGSVNQTTITFSGPITTTVGIVVNLIEGIYNWFYSLFDFAGNSYTTQNNTLTIDLTNPTISIVYPASDSLWFNSNIGINFTSNAANCWWSNNSGQTNNTLTNCTNISTQTWEEGSNTVTIYINDSAGNINSASRQFNIDRIYPQVNMTYPLNTSYKTMTAFNYTLTEANKYNCWYTLNDLVPVSITCGTNKTGLTPDEGSNTWTIYANDSAGNVNSSSVTFFIDTTAPELTIVSPEPKVYSVTSFELNYTVTDSSPLSSCWYRNDTDATNISINCGTNVTISQSDGSHTIYLWANDTFNNVASASVTYSISTTAPSVSLNYPTNNQYLNVSNVILNFTATDSDGIDTCQLWGNWSGSWALNQTLTSVSSGVQTSFSQISLSQGSYIWNVWCNDTLNIDSWALSNFTFTVDTTNPNATLLTPANASILNNGSVNFTVNFTDNIRLFRYTLNIYNSSGLASSSTAFISGTEYILSKIITLIDGTYTWFAGILDFTRNSYATENRTFTIDTANPNIAIVYPTNNQWYNSQIGVNYTISDINFQSCKWTKDLGVTNNFINCGTNIIGQTWSQGSNTVTIYANDSAGNTNSSSVTFNIDTINPLLNITFPTKSWYNYSIQVSYNASDANTLTCKSSLNGATNITSTCNQNISYSWAANNNLTIYVTDLAGNVNSSNVFFNIDSSAPSAILISPTNNTYSKNTTQNLTVNLTDNLGIKNSTLNLYNSVQSYCYQETSNASNINDGNCALKYDGKYSVKYPTNWRSAENISDGDWNTYGYYVYATGNYFVNYTKPLYSSGAIWQMKIGTSGIFNVTISDSCFNAYSDKIVLRMDTGNEISQFDSYCNNGSAFILIGNEITGDVKIYEEAIYWNMSKTLVNQTTTVYSPGIIQSTLGIVVTLIDNVYNWFYSLFDFGDNQVDSNINTLTIDTTSPSIIITTPENITYSTINILLNVTFNDASPLYNYWYTLSDGVPISFTNPQIRTFNAGSNNLTVYANDSAGNINSTNRIFYVTYTDKLGINLTHAPTSPEVGSSVILTAITSTDNTIVNECNFSLRGPTSTIYNNVKGTGSVTWTSGSTTITEAGNYTYNVTCINEFGARNSTTGNFTTSPYALTILTPSNPFSFSAKVIKTELKNITFELYDNVATTINYTVNVQIDNPINFVINYPASFLLNAADSSLNPKTFYITFQASSGVVEGLYYGNVTLNNTATGTLTVIPFTYGINPPSAIPRLFDSTSTACVGLVGGTCAINQGGLVQGLSVPYTFYMAKTGNYPLASNCSIKFSGDLNQNWITVSNPKIFNLNDNIQDNQFNLTLSPSTSTPVGTYRGLISIHCNQTDAIGSPSDSDNQIRADITINPAPIPNDGGGGGGGGPINITNLTTEVQKGICGNRICENGLNGTKNFNENYQSCPTDCKGNLAPITDCFNGGPDCIFKAGTALLWIGGFILLVLFLTSVIQFKKKGGSQRIAYLPTVSLSKPKKKSYLR